MHKSHTAVLCYLQNTMRQNMPTRSLWEDLYPARVTPTIISFLPPQGSATGVTGWATSVQQCHVQQGMMWEYRSSSIPNVIHSVAKKLWTDSLAPSSHSSLFAWHLQEHRTPRHCLQHPLSSCQQGYLHLPGGTLPKWREIGLSITEKTSWQPQAFGYFHRESGKTGKNRFFFKSVLGPQK